VAAGVDAKGWPWLLPCSSRRSASALFAALLALSCLPGKGDGAPPRALRVATSASLEHAGLFEVLAREFEGRTHRTLRPSFVGTGQALALGRSGAADVVWVHSRVSEDAFVAEGYGINRRDVMHSDYVIVGPPEDPARIGGLVSAVDAFLAISKGNAAFVSRGDESGNHDRERAIWKLAGVEPSAPWYTALGAGMWATLEQASERGAYALSDLQTYVVNRGKLRSLILVRGDERLQNRYAVIAVNPARVSAVDYSGAMEFVDFLTSPAAQELIAGYGRAEYGTSLFVPSGGTPSAP
jgi:tungstate transport system substrate-binding protein